MEKIHSDDFRLSEGREISAGICHERQPRLTSPYCAIDLFYSN